MTSESVAVLGHRLPARPKVRWGASIHGAVQHLVSDVSVYASPRSPERHLALEAHWLCGAFAMEATLLPDDWAYTPRCRKCEALEVYPAGPVVYRAFDADERLLYVGSTVNFVGRQQGHASSSEWYGQVERWDLERFDSEIRARLAEKAAIWDEKPIYNVQGQSPRIA